MPRALVPLLAITLVDVLGFTILIPLLPPSAAMGVWSLLPSPFSGRLGDPIGRTSLGTGAA
jgi:hypothetical protein